MSESDTTEPPEAPTTPGPADGRLTPPYGGFRPFWTFVEELRASGAVPQQIDGSVLGSNRSGAARSQLLVALRFFGLIDDDKRPTEPFKHLVLGDEPEQQFGEMAREAYAPLIDIDLVSATANQLNDALLRLGSGTGDTLRKTRLFFQSAADMSGIELGPHLRKRASTSTTRPRAKPKSRTKAPQAEAVASSADQPGMRHAVDLRSGGKVSIVVTVNLFDLDREDMEFVIGLVDALKSYRGASTPVPKS